MNRFRGALIALGALIVVGGGYAAVVLSQPARTVPEGETPELFAFEKEDLTGFRIKRPDLTIDMVKEGEQWVWRDTPWRPSASMVRRVGHQMHDLTARATVAPGGSLADYGLGEGAIEIELRLGDEVRRFQAGQPNPTSVSWYVRPLPHDEVYIVKKSAVDFWSMDVEDFRERRFAAVDADQADYIKAVVDDRTIEVRRVDAKQWQMSVPKSQPADRQMVRTMVGRTASLKATAFVEDAPKDLAAYGLEPPRHTINIRVGEKEPVTLHVGAVVPNTSPQERYVLRVEDNSVYSARDSFLDAYMEEVDLYRNKVILGLHESTLSKMTAHFEGEMIQVTRGPDGWRWEDGAKISGSTPGRLAARAAEASALGFHDDVEDLSEFGLSDPSGVVELMDADGVRTLTLGAQRVIPIGIAQAAEKRRYAVADGDPTVYEIDDYVIENLEALFREHRRKVEKDQEKGLLEEAPSEDPDAPEEPGG